MKRLTKQSLVVFTGLLSLSVIACSENIEGENGEVSRGELGQDDSQTEIWDELFQNGTAFIPCPQGAAQAKLHSFTEGFADTTYLGESTDAGWKAASTQPTSAQLIGTAVNSVEIGVDAGRERIECVYDIIASGSQGLITRFGEDPDEPVSVHQVSVISTAPEGASCHIVNSNGAPHGFECTLDGDSGIEIDSCQNVGPINVTLGNTGEVLSQFDPDFVANPAWLVGADQLFEQAGSCANVYINAQLSECGAANDLQLKLGNGLSIIRERGDDSFWCDNGVLRYLGRFPAQAVEDAIDSSGNLRMEWLNGSDATVFWGSSTFSISDTL